MKVISFNPLTLADLSRLYQWFQEPIIHQLYGRNQTWSMDAIEHKYRPRIMNEEAIPSFIIQQNDKAIGFIQYYCLQEFLPEGIENKSNPLFNHYQPEHIAGIDLFIADGVNRGQGLGAQIITQFITEFLTGYQCVVVDPEKTNLNAIRCYIKCGFSTTHFSSDKHYEVLMRKIDPDSLLITTEGNKP